MLDSTTAFMTTRMRITVYTIIQPVLEIRERPFYFKLRQTQNVVGTDTYIREETQII